MILQKLHYRNVKQGKNEKAEENQKKIGRYTFALWKKEQKQKENWKILEEEKKMQIKLNKELLLIWKDALWML